MTRIHTRLATASTALLLCGSGLATAQTTSPASLVAALRQGGLVVVMRHASSPAAVPTHEQANADNTTPERQLDQAGREGARAMGQAISDLRIPVGQVFISPTYRARETAMYAGLPNPRPTTELTDTGGQGMQGVPEASVAWLRRKMAETPEIGRAHV